MLIDLVIPSYHRNDKLTKCLNSINANFIRSPELLGYARVVVFFSDPQDYEMCHYHKTWFSKRMFKNYRVPEFWNDYLLFGLTGADVMVTLNDDVMVFKDTIEKIQDVFNSRFPDFDGVVGLNQYNIPGALDSAFCAIGYKYSDRFPDKRVYCPDYDRFFADQELGIYAKSINKFYFAEDIRVTHYHASFYPEMMDETHSRVREYLNQDNKTFRIRQGFGFLWGKNFNLIKGASHEV